MYQHEFDSFKSLISDVCTAFNRPFTDDLVRVFWEALKPYPLQRVRWRIKFHIGHSKKFPAPIDLRPEDESKPQRSFTEKNSHPNDDLVSFVLRNYPLTPHQIAMPWNHLGKFFDAPDLTGQMRKDHGVEFTGVVIPACPFTGASGFRVMRQDMAIGEAA